MTTAGDPKKQDDRVTHYVILHCVSSGLNGADLGSDESEIVLLMYLVIDLSSKKVRRLRND